MKILILLFDVKKIIKIFCFSLCIYLTSCIELIDDITINSDGSGKLKYSINLSSSKTECNSLILLDSLNGYKVPKIEHLKAKIVQFEKIISLQPGISQVQIESNWQDFIFKFSCDFDNLHNLQTAVKVTLKLLELPIGQNFETDWIYLKESCLIRDVPHIILNNFSEFKFIRQEELELSRYTSITRFDKEISYFENISARLSQNKKAVMIQTDLKNLIDNSKKLNNKICISN